VSTEAARVALVTNVSEYAGPGAVRALADNGYLVASHSRSFADASVREEFAASDERLRPIAEQDPDALVQHVLAELGRVDVLVSNDYLPGNRWGNSSKPATSDLPVIRKIALEELGVDEIRRTFEELVVKPCRLCQAVLPGMKERGSGAIIFITSAASYRAHPDYPAYGAARSATTSLAQALAVAVAPNGVQVNVIGPAWFENPSFFQAEHRESYMPIVEREVPAQRLATQQELGALIAFLVSGLATPLTGQFLAFTMATGGTGLRG